MSEARHRRMVGWALRPVYSDGSLCLGVLALATTLGPLILIWAAA
jgi:hypothetical protein